MSKEIVAPDRAVFPAETCRIDITRDTCPMTFVRTRLALDRMAAGEVLLVVLRGEEPRRNVPRTAAEQGHAVLGLAEEADGTARLWIRKGG
ncbi:sulfurtransferase TusA family protein [Roseomonas populi]|uniref:Sulfurtransferase TusA family protein n=1 Tax=Roseomonas populi TaxID=3121582 RepID=A0ABT1X8L0_9PROT|nr:sulfurtransferase TusA family protein [Roseomonas pecuniae]MCR0983314.1 sulfurtransferase TusA family protein [Roseomonas pecuniae]